MPGPPMLQGPFRVPSFNGYIPRRLQPWIYLLFAFIFLMSGGIYGGAMSQVMGEYSLMREDVLMIIMFNVVGVAMPFPFLFKMKFHFTNRQLLGIIAIVFLPDPPVTCRCQYALDLREIQLIPFGIIRQPYVILHADYLYDRPVSVRDIRKFCICNQFLYQFRTHTVSLLILNTCIQ